MRLKIFGLALTMFLASACSDDTAGSAANNQTVNNNTVGDSGNNAADGANNTVVNNVSDAGWQPDLPFEVNDAGQVLWGRSMDSTSSVPVPMTTTKVVLRPAFLAITGTRSGRIVSLMGTQAPETTGVATRPVA
jgi:hypothetical protein